MDAWAVVPGLEAHGALEQGIAILLPRDSTGTLVGLVGPPSAQGQGHESETSGPVAAGTGARLWEVK